MQMRHDISAICHELFQARRLRDNKNNLLTSTDKTDKIYQSYCIKRYEKVSEKQAVQSEGER